MARLIRLYVPPHPISSHSLGNNTDNDNKQVSQADKTYSSTKSQAEALAKDTKAEALKKIDQFDRTVEQKAAEAKSGVSSWFGSGSSK